MQIFANTRFTLSHPIDAQPLGSLRSFQSDWKLPADLTIHRKPHRESPPVLIWNLDLASLELPRPRRGPPPPIKSHVLVINDNAQHLSGDFLGAAQSTANDLGKPRNIGALRFDLELGSCEPRSSAPRARSPFASFARHRSVPIRRPVADTRGDRPASALAGVFRNTQHAIRNS